MKNEAASCALCDGSTSCYSAVHARFRLKDDVFQKLALVQDKMEGDDDDGSVVATPTNGTIQSILQELNLNKRY